MALKYRTLIKRFFDIFISSKLKNAPKTIPLLYLDITHRCPSRCKMCDMWMTPSERGREELSTKEYIDLIDQAQKMGTLIISVGGGEPLYREDCLEILENIRKRGISAHINTNGLLIDARFRKKAREIGLNAISISLDGADALTHNTIRGQDQFETIIENLSSFIRDVPATSVTVNFLWNRYNISHLNRMIPFLETLGPINLKITPIHTNLQHRDKSIETFGDLLFTSQDISQIEKIIKGFTLKFYHHPARCNSISFLRKIPSFYGNFKPSPCYCGFFVANMDPYGNVFPCYDYREGAANLRNTTLKSIWHGSSMQNLRKKVLSCNYKCWNMGTAEPSLLFCPSYLIQHPLEAWRSVSLYS